MLPNRVYGLLSLSSIKGSYKSFILLINSAIFQSFKIQFFFTLKSLSNCRRLPNNLKFPPNLWFKLTRVVLIRCLLLGNSLSFASLWKVADQKVFRISVSPCENIWLICHRYYCYCCYYYEIFSYLAFLKGYVKLLLKIKWFCFKFSGGSQWFCVKFFHNVGLYHIETNEQINGLVSIC